MSNDHPKRKVLLDLNDGAGAVAAGPAIIFVHGFASTPGASWGRLINLISSDVDFSRYDLSCFSYPTMLIRNLFATRMATIQQIAQGLKTEIEALHSKRSEIILVGHSLGGLIVRRYVLDELKSGKEIKTTRLALYAVPNTGAALARLGQGLSWKHHHLRQLCRDSDLLRDLNQDWYDLKADEKCTSVYIVGGADAIVTPESAAPTFDQSKVKTLIGHDHSSIIQVEAQDDPHYIVLKKFVVESFSANVGSRQLQRATTAESISGPVDPLFDVYTSRDAHYYLLRPIDKIVSQTLSSNHLWLSGASGLGKTAVTRHTLLSTNKSLIHIMLASYSSGSARAVLKAFHTELASALAVTKSLNRERMHQKY